jgi:sigma-E factor negative regulatory protein RseC
MSANEGSIIHPGIIEKIEEDKILVKILSQSACSTCHAKAACMVSDVEEKIVEVNKDRAGHWKEGEQVNVHMRKSLGPRAVFLGYLMPLIVLVVALIILVSLIHNEGIAALLSLLLLIPYYFVLYLFKDKIGKTFSFYIE